MVKNNLPMTRRRETAPSKNFMVVNILLLIVTDVTNVGTAFAKVTVPLNSF